MYQKACGDVRYAHAVAYISTHLICAVRDTDLSRLHHPVLPCGAQEVLDRICGGRMDDGEASRGAEAFFEYMSYRHLIPHKNLAHSGIPELVLRIPQSLEAHFGKIYLICQAHIELGHVPDDEPPLFKRVSDYKSLQKLFGDDVAGFFRERDLCPTAMSKTFMQAVSIEAGQHGGAIGPQNAVLFALSIAGWARSHKGSASSFSETTLRYLRDGALGLLSADMVERELFERLTTRFPMRTIIFVTHSKQLAGMCQNIIRL